jgi:hypothetical protein
MPFLVRPKSNNNHHHNNNKISGRPEEVDSVRKGQREREGDHRPIDLEMGAASFGVIRARPLILHPYLHLHFYIRDADVDAGKCPTQSGIICMWMKNFPGGA